MYLPNNCHQNKSSESSCVSLNFQVSHKFCVFDFSFLCCSFYLCHCHCHCRCHLHHWRTCWCDATLIVSDNTVMQLWCDSDNSHSHVDSRPRFAIIEAGAAYSVGGWCPLLSLPFRNPSFTEYNLVVFSKGEMFRLLGSISSNSSSMTARKPAKYTRSTSISYEDQLLER